MRPVRHKSEHALRTAAYKICASFADGSPGLIIKQLRDVEAAVRL